MGGGKSTDQPGDPLGQGWGRGAYNAAADLWEYYDYPKNSLASGDGLSWSAIWAHWDLIEADMQDRGVDLSGAAVDPDTQRWAPLLTLRSGRWLRVRILGLLTADTRLYRRLTAPQTEN